MFLSTDVYLLTLPTYVSSFQSILHPDLHRSCPLETTQSAQCLVICESNSPLWKCRWWHYIPRETFTPWQKPAIFLEFTKSLIKNKIGVLLVPHSNKGDLQGHNSHFSMATISPHEVTLKPPTGRAMDIHTGTFFKHLG